MALNGIDIASHQAGLDLSRISFDFVIIKATQGIGYVNPYCDGWYQQAKGMGKLLGFYHYASGNDPVGEADYFINNTINYFHEAVPCLDWESEQNPNWGNNDAGWVKAFCDHVYERTGVHPIVYIQASAMGRLEGKIGDCGLWVAQYPNYDATGYQETPWNEGTYQCVIRQYASTGFIDGYGPLDLDKFYGDAGTWAKYADPEGAPMPTPSPIEKKEDAIYRLYNPNNGDHLLTADYDEACGLLTHGWVYEEIAFYQSGDIPVYRLYNQSNGQHMYTVSEKEKTDLINAGWKDEGVAFTCKDVGIPIYRTYNQYNGQHLFTDSVGEVNTVVKNGWYLEGVGWHE